MNYTDYEQYMLETITNATPKYIQKNILNQLIECGIAIEGKKELEGQIDVTERPIPIDLSEYNGYNLKLENCIKLSKHAVKLIEKWEFTKSYRYSAIFLYKGSLDQSINNIIDNNKAKEYSNKTECFDEIKFIIDYPTIYRSEDLVLMKFSYGRRYFDPGNGREVRIKYPIIVVFFEKLGVLEIRMDTASSSFKTGDEFYVNKIKEVREWIKRIMNIDVENLNVQNILEEIKVNKNDEVVVFCQYMNLSQGGKATLNVGANKDYVLPIIGDLKNLLEVHQGLFSKSDEIEEIREIKRVLVEFIEGMEKKSDFPRMTLCWKECDIVVEFIHCYKSSDFTLLQHYGEQRSVERMDYVTKYLIKYTKID